MLKITKGRKTIKHELFRYKVRNLLTAICTVGIWKLPVGFSSINSLKEIAEMKGYSRLGLG
jgi:hypothetical protein